MPAVGQMGEGPAKAQLGELVPYLNCPMSHVNSVVQLSNCSFVRAGSPREPRFAISLLPASSGDVPRELIFWIGVIVPIVPRELIFWIVPICKTSYFTMVWTAQSHMNSYFGLSRFSFYNGFDSQMSHVNSYFGLSRLSPFST